MADDPVMELDPQGEEEEVWCDGSENALRLDDEF